MSERNVRELTFDEAVYELASISGESKRIEDRVKALKDRIRETYPAQNLRRTKQTLYADVASLGSSVSISEPEPTYKFNPTRLRELIDDDELFLDIIILDTVKLDPDKWVIARQEERVLDDWLEDSMIETLPTPRISVTKLKQTPNSEVGDDLQSL